VLTAYLQIPAFIASLGMFYVARGLAAWLVSGRQLSGFPDSFNLLGRKAIDVLSAWDFVPECDVVRSFVEAVSVQTLLVLAIACIASVILGRTVAGQMVYATGGNIQAARQAGVPVEAVRLCSFIFSGLCAAAAGIIYVAYFRSFNPAAGALQEVYAITAAVIGGASLFGGYGTIFGSLAGAAVIALARALLSLQVFVQDGRSFTMPQQWGNLLIGFLLIAAVLGDIWVRQSALVGRLSGRFSLRV
jgi:ribose transport system permease protein